jgi:CheY-like chemotaxis protein
MTSVTPTPPVVVSPRILIADADANTRSRYQEAFERVGCDVIEAGDGHEALLRVLEQPPTLVLTDVDLPLLDGIALCDVLKKGQRHRWCADSSRRRRGISQGP